MSAPSANSRSSVSGWPVFVFGGLCVFALYTLTQRWSASILDRYEFRQLQTALSAHWMQREGFHLDYLTPLFGPPWSIPMEFPTYQAIVAALASLLGAPLEQTGRAVSLLAFAATLPAVFHLLGLVLPAARSRLLALAVVLTAPVYLFYARTFMIETTALCLAVWFLVAFERTLATRRPLWLTATVALAVLAALTKITTFLVYLVPAATLAFTVRRENAGPFKSRLASLLLAAGPVALALGVTLWWVARSDALKHSNPYTGFLASTELRQWNYGTLAQRLDPDFWLQLWQHITQHVLSEGALALAALAAAFASARARWTACVCVVGFFAGPLVFANLYHVHDYYFAANALLLTAAAGLLLASASEHPAFPRAAVVTGFGLLLAFQYHAFDRGLHYHFWKKAPPPPALATLVRESVPADDVVLISGADWNPLLPYYSQRRAIMVAGDRDDEASVLEDVVRQLPPRRISAMILVGEKARTNSSLIRERAARFGLAPQPFARSADADLYLPAEVVADTARRLTGRDFGDTRLLLAVPAAPVAPDLREQSGPELEFKALSPAPFRALSRFGITALTVDHSPVVSAHAPSALYFHPPAGARRISAVVALASSSFAQPPPDGTDGVVVEIFLQQTDGLRRTLLRRELNPATRPTDRGPQLLTYDHGTPLVGEVIFSITPGAANNAAYDQAYWSSIEVR